MRYIIKNYDNIGDVPKTQNLINVGALAYDALAPDSAFPTRTSLQILQDYYTNLLIIQYKTKIKSRATIQALIKELIPVNTSTGNLLFSDIRDAFNIATATGVNLDIIGKYVGCSRQYKTQLQFEAFSFLTYEHLTPTQYQDGMNTYNTWTGSTGVFATYNSNGGNTQTNYLSDDDFRTLIYLKIAKNKSNSSYGSIDSILYSIFGNSVSVSGSGGMRMLVQCDPAQLQLVQVAIEQDVFPRPTTVNFVGIMLNNQTSPNVYSQPITFAFEEGSSYDRNTTNGMNTYDNWNGQVGIFLQYNNIINV
jgi:uncharacterized protein YxeA